jgi:hypothetical protein
MFAGAGALKRQVLFFGHIAFWLRNRGCLHPDLCAFGFALFIGLVH